MPFSYPFVRRTPKECGTPSTVRGLGVFGQPGCIVVEEGGSRKNEVGRTLVRRGGFNFDFKVLARAPGFLSVAMVLREEFRIDSLRMIVFLGSKFLRRSKSSRTPLYLAAGIRHVSWFSGPMLSTFLAGAIRTWICSSPRAPPFQESLRGDGNCV